MGKCSAVLALCNNLILPCLHSFIEKSLKSLSKVSQKSLKSPSKVSQKSFKSLSKVSQMSLKRLSNVSQKALIVSWLRPTDRQTDRQTMSLIELSWTAKKGTELKSEAGHHIREIG